MTRENVCATVCLSVAIPIVVLILTAVLSTTAQSSSSPGTGTTEAFVHNGTTSMTSTGDSDTSSSDSSPAVTIEPGPLDSMTSEGAPTTGMPDRNTASTAIPSAETSTVAGGASTGPNTLPTGGVVSTTPGSSEASTGSQASGTLPTSGPETDHQTQTSMQPETQGTDVGEGGTSSQSPNTGSTDTPGISCYTCTTTNMSDPCFGEQGEGRRSAVCAAGEFCWTTRHNNAKTFVNLTRGCSPDSCKKEHKESEGAVLCQSMQDAETCTQCCEKNLCNKHKNTAGMAPSGCLWGVLLSVVAVLGLIHY
ncbi:mucin-5AC-like isoform X2 [Acanthaster planci]|uniref:Mucin-5AC-like isoform X2 n=1 Tax=Acanthaster planci TaxID=133434 RepID=A0A8B7YLR9_ACAPL|nr:mucin-5AC-like isoform X2 [Acanthaster planci]